MRLLILNSLIFSCFLLCNIAFAQDTEDTTIQQGKEAPENEKTIDLKESDQYTYQPFNGKNINTLNKDSFSLFYENDDLVMLYNAVLANKTIIEDLADEESSDLVENDEVAQDFTGKNSNTKTFISPSFYLAIILYPNDDSWTVWLNKKKYRKEAGLDNEKLEVIKVSKTAMLLKFQTDNLDIISPEFRANLEPLSNDDPLVKEKNSGWDYASKKRDILLDSTRGIFKFKLGINQSFSVYDAKITEGFVAPKKIVVTYNDDGTYIINENIAEPTNNSGLVEDLGL